MTAKLIDVFIVSLLVCLVYIIVALVIGFVSSSSVSAWDQTKYIGLFALQTFAQLSLAFLVAFLVRKSFISLGIFLFYYIILEPILVGLAKAKANDIGRFMPLEISDRLIPRPTFLRKLESTEEYDAALKAINIHILYTFIVLIIVWAFCYWVNKKRDL